MTGATHRAGGMLVSIVGFAILREKGLLLKDVNEAVQWLVMYPFTMWGSVASDLDHHWESCPQKDIPSRVINIALHSSKPVQKLLDKVMPESKRQRSLLYSLVSLFNAQHRSWQTHSDLTLFAMLYLLYMLFVGGVGCLSAVDNAVLTLVLTGVCLGTIAHLMLDSITPEGVWLICPTLLNQVLRLFKVKSKLPQKLHFVPKTAFFATGGAWEQFIRKLLKFCTVVAILWFAYVQLAPIVAPYIPYELQIY